MDTMARILARLAFAIVSTALASGCAVQAGLASGPQLGGTTVPEERVHDAIANGQESCGPLDPGPLRYRAPPCPEQ
jgi:hypothetical protein